jgi:hypothetical protein
VRAASRVEAALEKDELRMSSVLGGRGGGGCRWAWDAGVHLCHQSACPLREHECPLSTPPSGKRSQ